MVKVDTKVKVEEDEETSEEDATEEDTTYLNDGKKTTSIHNAQ
jgi:hypothetical protein